jgi:CobQ-like glutamine amidotransferase family enzyme
LTDGSIVYTLLHGPVLAKSPELLTEILKYLGVESEEGERFERLRGIRQLAIDTARSLD